MKLRNIFTVLATAALTFVGCQEDLHLIDEFQVSETMIALPVEGGQFEVTIKATADWAVAENDEWPNVIERYTKDEGNHKKGSIKKSTPSWLSIDVVSGTAGEYKVVFSAEATDGTRECNVPFACAGYQHTIKVFQMAEKVEIPLSTCAEVNNNGVDGKVYRVKGTCTSIANTQYGNWYLKDDTGTVYIYGTLYNGATQQFTKLGLEVGDIVTVEGPRKDYNGTIELVDVTVLEIEKSLIKLEKMISTPLPLDGGVATALLTVKDGDFSVEIPEDATWLTAGEPTTVGGLTCVELTAAPNEGGARSTTVTFKTTVNGKDYIAPAEIEQYGAIAAVSVADFLAAPEGTALYELTGIVKNLKSDVYGNFDLVDATGSVYVYGLTGNGAIGTNDKTFANLGINEGDVITIVGTRASYKETAQVGGTAYLKEHVVAASVATVAEFLAQPKGTWCKLTGTLSNLKSDVYGNFDLVDETGSVYVYGLTTSYVAKNDKSFANLGLKEGDVVTLVGKRDSYNDQDQVGGPAYYISHVAAEGGEEPEQPEVPVVMTLTNAEICAMMTSAETSYVDYTIESASGVWTVNASQNNANTFLQCRGRKGSYIKTPAFEKDIKSVTLHFSEAKSVYADNVYCAFPAAWTAPTEDAAYPEDGNVGRAVTDGSYSVTIPVAAGNKQVSVSLIGTYSYYIDHIDVEL